MNRFFRSRRAALLTSAVLVLGAAAGLTGCTQAGQTLPPVIVDLGEIDGTTVEVPVGNVIDLTGDDEHFTAWSADIADPSIVSFTPGKDDGSAQFNPGLDALKEGTTEVTLDNADSGDSVSFTVEVTPKS
ncbi:hypothetical protein GCM10025768_06630 [Microbacterium pseudoresistens]|uniref:Desulfoferrodoxin (Superoxide reductase-like protein) n=1 Tax=Microbacterium pseudoresistens TaxID=640634 RepID=A0A7Y9EWT2_9MICO|nr:hypothetical protein [Microbacterium pseudoresistens]NYD54500.1 desulfoferrodoxin (superoxide reductase-like protein) [Microbacterium pseudoresistens]